MKFKVGDRVECVESSHTLDLYLGDRGVVLGSYGNDSLSIHFDKWDAGDQNWREGMERHHVDGKYAFYIGHSFVKLVNRCMFSKGGA
jgi:hypothetical protein